MGGVILFLIIVGIVIYKSMRQDESPKAAEEWKPHFAEGWSDPPPHVLNYKTRKDNENKAWDAYCENHYFDIYNEIWVKDIGTEDDEHYVLSCDFEDFLDGEEDERGEIPEMKYRPFYVPAEEYSGDPGWAEEYRKRHHLWMITGEW